MLCWFANRAQTDDAFGDSIPIAHGLVGRVVLLPDSTTRLPNLDSLPALETKLYTPEINIPSHTGSAGFPGLRSRFEYFGIDYQTEFDVSQAAVYHFRLLSDDGSLLWIDDSLLIDNDGIHAEREKTAEIYLAQGRHKAKLYYFQGPRYRLGLQLFYHLSGQPEQIFPGKMFLLHARQPYSYWPWVIGAVLIIVIMIVGYRYAGKHQERS